MRVLEIIAALILALVVFAAFKLIGVVVHIALVGAAVGLVIGFIIARAFRKA
jgi:positive regulator of sigma E activity